MRWQNRDNADPERKFTDLEQELGIENLNDVQIDTTALKLYLFTDSAKYSIPLTLES